MTIATKIKIAAVVLAVLALGLGWAEIKSLRADNRQLKAGAVALEQTVAGAQAEAAALRQELAASLEALARREEARAELAAQAETLRQELEELYQNDKPCQTWADSPVPDPVYRRLRK